MKSLSPCFFVLLLILVFCTPSPAISSAASDKGVREAVTAFVATRTGGMGWDVRIRRLTIAGVLRLPEGKVDYEVDAPQQWQGWGNVSLAVIGRQNEKVVLNVPVQVDVEALAETVVTLRQINHGELISPSDLVLQKREITHNSHLAARKIAEIAGKKARTTLRANQPVRADQVESVPLVKSGQMVTIVAENEVLKVSVSGKARSSGAEGDVIRVQNLTSLKEIPARVISATTVQVAF